MRRATTLQTKRRGYRSPAIRTLFAILASFALTRWVAFAQTNADQPHWSFRPIDTGKPPVVASGQPAKSPVDSFIAAGLGKNGATFARNADPRTLLRRVTYDLTGLPPSPEELASFLSDTSPEAFSRCVDRLLASPRYGERWGRWWLDLARYADTNGQDENKAMSNAWRYRDWVVRQFNADLPFDEFIVDQIAGDLLPASPSHEINQDRWIATGFLVLGPKMLAEQDKPKLVMDVIDEQIDTIGRAFLGLTLSCARCHDHKFDPIPTRDYYALAGILRSTRTMENLDFVSKFNERKITPSARLKVIEAHQALVASREERIKHLVSDANAALTNHLKGPLPNDPKAQYPVATKAEIERLEQERDSLKSSVPPTELALSVVDAEPVNVPVFKRGNHLTPAGEPVPRGFIEVIARPMSAAAVPSIPGNRSGRLELAQWLIAPGNPLTARVIVNRVWQAHFGQGLVRTSDNFGVRGEAPSHPELLDWLARELIRDGWQLKQLHRRIVQSAVYQQASAWNPSDPKCIGERDPDNRLLSHFPRRRLEAEMIRDALLASADCLDTQMGGTLVRWKNNEYAPGETEAFKSLRRSIYLPIVRDRVFDVFTLFDFANPSVGVSRRESTEVAHQALFFLNSSVVREAARSLAQALEGSNARSDLERVNAVYHEVLGRNAAPWEREKTLEFVQKIRGDLAGVDNTSTGQIEVRVWTACYQALFSSNEFLYID